MSMPLLLSYEEPALPRSARPATVSASDGSVRRDGLTGGAGQRGAPRRKPAAAAAREPAATTAGEPAPAPADIARRAYQIFERRGGEHGQDLSDWFTAERELQAELAGAGRPSGQRRTIGH